MFATPLASTPKHKSTEKFEQYKTRVFHVNYINKNNL